MGWVMNALVGGAVMVDNLSWVGLVVQSSVRLSVVRLVLKVSHTLVCEHLLEVKMGLTCLISVNLSWVGLLLMGYIQLESVISKDWLWVADLVSI